MTREARALRAVKSHPTERRSAGRDSSSGGGAVVVRVQLINTRYEICCVSSESPRMHDGRTTRARTRTQLGCAFHVATVLGRFVVLCFPPRLPRRKSEFGRGCGTLPRALGRERRESDAMSSRRNDGPGNNVAKVVTFESTQQQLAVYQKSEPNEVRPSNESPARSPRPAARARRR